MAATLLQRLLRGRAVQNTMYEGRLRRYELIQELRLQGSDAGMWVKAPPMYAVTM
jgi:hypothetical protein